MPSCAATEIVQLSPLDVADLAAREARIEQALADINRNFVVIGQELAAIHDRKLYRASGLSWENYCRDRFHISAPHAHRLMAGEKAYRNLVLGTETLPAGKVLPTSESVIRPLTLLPSEQQASGWAAAVDAAGGQPPTAVQVEAATTKLFNSLSPEDQKQVLDDEWQELKTDAKPHAPPEPDAQRLRKGTQHLHLARNRFYHHPRATAVVDLIDQALEEARKL